MANEGVSGEGGWGRGLEERERRKRKNRRVGRKGNLTTVF